MPKAYPDLRLRPTGATSTSSVPFLDPIPNLHTVGRNGMHKYNNQDHSMFSAMMAVANIEGASHDIWAVNTDFEYHEEQRIPGDPPTVGVLKVTAVHPDAERRRVRRPARSLRPPVSA